MKGVVGEMKIFQRVMQFKPECVYEGMAKVSEAVGYMNSNTDVPWYGWQVMTGAPVGAVAVSSRIEDMSSFLDTQMALLSDDGYLSLAKDITAMYAEPAQDWMMSPIAGSENMPAEPSEFLVNTLNRSAFDKVSRGIDLSQQFCSMVTGIAGTPSAGLMTTLGEGGVTFALLLYYDSLAQYEERQNPEVWSMVGDSPLQAEAQEVFDPAATWQTLTRRIA
ncbi:MAG: hypothetical protein CL456_04640 [Acidimicrobiaceae bacterium]|nr:hypothetical protein [Acidimicrobiaceae bacterium]|tara:strand:- start:25537 stop:26196 length:660 start_codon:yes stop_codon:yes gene_type:complete